MKKTHFLFSPLIVVLLTCLPTAGVAQSIQPGTGIRIRLLDKLDTHDAKQGQFFSATLAEPVSVGSKKVLARGTRVKGQVLEASSYGRLKRPASITLILTSLDKTPIQTETLHVDGGKGAATGMAVGTGAGTATAYLTVTKEVVLPRETELEFVAADPRATAVRTPEPVVERNIDRGPQSRSAIWHEDSREDNDDAYDALIFSERDKWLIHSYFQSNYGNLPPALAGRGDGLPPGLEKRLRPEQTLPRDLQNRVEPLPAELERQLPRLPLGYSRVFLSGRVMVLGSDEQIVDLMFISR